MSATWDSKSPKATPVSADEILIIDTEDSRNQKRATLGSFGAGIWTKSSTFIFPTTLTDFVGIGTNSPKQPLHVLTDGTISLWADVDAGILITSVLHPKLILEDAGETADDKTFQLRNQDQVLSFDSMNDEGSGFVTQNIMALARGGNITLGGIPGTALLQLGQDNNGDLLNFNSDRAWTFGASGTGGAARLTLRPDIDSKFFDIITQDQLSTVASFFAVNIPANGRIFLNPDGGIVTIGNITPSTRSVLDITSTTQGVLLPRMTTVQKDAIASTASLLVNDTDLNTLERNSGVEWRSFATQGDTTREAWQISDFPAAVSNVITLASGISFLRKTTSTADRFDFGTSQNILFNGVDNLNLSLTYTGVVTFFTAATNTAWDINDIAIICSGNNAQIFDITSGNVNINSSNFTMSGTTPTIGTLTGTVEAFMRDLTFTGYETGFTLDATLGLVLEDTVFRSNQLGTGATVNITGQLLGFVEVDTCPFVLGQNEAAFFIDPQIINTVTIKDCFVPIGKFFQSAATGTFSAASDEGETHAVLSVLNGSPNAIFTFSGSFTNVVDGDTIVHTGFAESTYNGTFQIFNIAGSAYEVRDRITQAAVAFVAGDTGSGTTSLTRFTSTAHGLSSGDNVIVNSTNYVDTGSAIRGTPLTNSFDLKIPFNGTDTGTWQVDAFPFLTASDLSVSNTITSVEAIAFGTRFVASGGISGLVADEIVTHSGFTTALQYNGVFKITNILSNSYDVVRQPAQFTVTDTGTSDSNLTRFGIVLHGISNDAGVQLKSLLYNEGGRVQSSLTNTIDISVAFKGDDSGTANINSLDQTDPRVTVQDSTGSPNSKITGELHIEAVASPVVVTITATDTPVVIDTTSWTSENLERVLATTGGVITFIGLKETSLLVNFSGLVEKVAGGATEIGIGLFKNGAAISGFVYPRSVNAGVVQVSGTRTILMDTDDTLEMVVINFGNTDNIEVSQADLIISEAP